MNTLRSHHIFFAAVFCLFAVAAQGQVLVNVSTPTKAYLEGEAVIATVKITNNAGRALTFVSKPRQSWLEIVMKDRKGKDIIAFKNGLFRSATVPAGQTIARNVNLSSLFNLQKLGNFSFSAVVRHEEGSIGSQSNRTFFNVSRGKIHRSFRVGVPGKKGELREQRMISFNGNNRTYIYAQLWDVNAGYAIRTKRLSEVVLFRKPQAAIDKKNSMHMVYQVSPELFNYIVTDVNGKLIETKQFKRSKSGEPRLESFADGNVSVLGGANFDRVAERERKLQIHRLSDRPTAVFK